MRLVLAVFAAVSTAAAQQAAPTAAPWPASSASKACGLLTPADVKPLLGAAKQPKPIEAVNGCTWGGAGSGPPNNFALMITAPASSTAAEYQQIKAMELKNHPDRVSKEPGLGGEAFGEITSYGARIVVLKGGRMLQIQFTTGKKGTAAQLDALRAVAKKATAAF
jgi:hypothetical protein